MSSQYTISITESPELTANLAEGVDAAEAQAVMDSGYTLPYLDKPLKPKQLLNIFVPDEELDDDFDDEYSDEEIAHFKYWRELLDYRDKSIGNGKFQDIDDFIGDYLDHVKLQRGRKEPVTFLYDFKSNTTGYEDVMYMWLETPEYNAQGEMVMDDRVWFQPYVLLQIYYGVYKIYEQENDELHYQLEKKEQDKVKKLIGLVTRTTQQTPVTGNTQAVINWVDREQKDGTTPMRDHYTQQEIPTEQVKVIPPKWTSNRLRQVKNSILFIQKKINTITNKVPIMEAIVKEAEEDGSDVDEDDIAEARHFLSRYRTRLRLSEQGLTSLLKEKKNEPTTEEAAEEGGFVDTRKAIYLRQDPTYIAKMKAEQARRDEYVKSDEDARVAFEQVWQAFLNDEKRKQGARSGIEEYLNSIKEEAYKQGNDWKNFAGEMVEEWKKEQAVAAESSSTQPQMANTLPSQNGRFAVLVKGSPSQAERRAAIKRRREQEQLETTPPTQKKIKYEVAINKGKKRKVYLGGFKRVGRNSPQKRGKLAHGFERVLDAGNRHDDLLEGGFLRRANSNPID